MSSKIHTVNVVELYSNSIVSCHSFKDTPKGNKAAERLFREFHKEHNDPDGTTGILRPTRAEFDAMLENGIYNDDK